MGEGTVVEGWDLTAIDPGCPALYFRIISVEKTIDKFGWSTAQQPIGLGAGHDSAASGIGLRPVCDELACNKRSPASECRTCDSAVCDELAIENGDNTLDRAAIV